VERALACLEMADDEVAPVIDWRIAHARQELADLRVGLDDVVHDRFDAGQVLGRERPLDAGLVHAGHAHEAPAPEGRLPAGAIAEAER
jgi:hypothetical protein